MIIGFFSKKNFAEAGKPQQNQDQRPASIVTTDIESKTDLKSRIKKKGTPPGSRKCPFIA